MFDCNDEHNFMTDLEVECIHYDIKLILVWSFQEAAMYLRTLKAYEAKGKNQLNGISKATTVREQAIEALSSIRKIQKRDADRLLDRCGSIESIIME